MSPDTRSSLKRRYPDAKPVIMFGRWASQDAFAIWSQTDGFLSPWRPTIEAAFTSAYNVLGLSSRW